MYYTITLNPAIDMIVNSDEINIGSLNRVKEAKYIIGGKGINISLLLNKLNKETTTLGFIAGFTGNYIKEELKKLKIKENFVEVNGTTRINIKLKNNTETEINSESSPITDKNIEDFYNSLNIINDKDTVFLSGNTILGMSSKDYKKIAKIITDKNARLIVDSNKELLLKTLEYKPFLIKPNTFELGEIFGITIKNEEDIIKYAKKLQNLGAKNVLVSNGKNGAILITKNNKIYLSNVAKGNVISTTASGDSMLAMFISKYDETKCYKKSLAYASAAGGATAFSLGIGDKKLIDKLVKQINIKNLN